MIRIIFCILISIIISDDIIDLLATFKVCGFSLATFIEIMKKTLFFILIVNFINCVH